MQTGFYLAYSFRYDGFTKVFIENISDQNTRTPITLDFGVKSRYSSLLSVNVKTMYSSFSTFS